MKDLKLDFTNKKLLNEVVNNQDRVVQHIKVAVRSWEGDFSLNSNFGVNYDVCWGNSLLAKSYISDQIKDISGVNSINSITISKEQDTNTLQDKYFKVDANITLDSGTIDISEVVKGLY